MPEEFTYINSEPDKYPGMRTIHVYNPVKGKSIAKEGDLEIFTHRHGLTSESAASRQDWIIEQNSDVFEQALKLTSGNESIRLVVIDSITLTVHFSFQGKHYEISPHTSGYQLKANNNPNPLAILIQTWRDSEIAQNIIYTIRAEPEVTPTLALCLYLVTRLDSNRRTPHYSIPFVPPE